MILAILLILIILLTLVVSGFITHTSDKLLYEGAGRKMNFSKIKPIEFTPYYHRTIEHLKRENYTKKPDWMRITLHAGQRKLLCNEVEFLTQYGGNRETVVYAGAAPGPHIVLLAQMFPNYDFHLYDPRDFYEELNETPNVSLHQQYFEDKTAEEWSDKNVLFISDIRTGSIESHGDGGDVEINMEQQQKWTEIIKPKYAMLKFRLPWSPGKTIYLAGDIYLQPWAGPSSTETRLITNGKDYKEYDHTEYEEKIQYYQAHNRSAYHIHNITSDGVDHCHDCWSEIQIIKNYLAKTQDLLGEKIEPDLNNIRKYIALFTKYTKKKLDVPPHGLYPEEKNIWKKIELMAAKAKKHERENKQRRAEYSAANPIVKLQNQ